MPQYIAFNYFLNYIQCYKKGRSSGQICDKQNEKLSDFIDTTGAWSSRYRICSIYFSWQVGTQNTVTAQIHPFLQFHVLRNWTQNFLITIPSNYQTSIIKTANVICQIGCFVCLSVSNAMELLTKRNQFWRYQPSLEPTETVLPWDQQSQLGIFTWSTRHHPRVSPNSQ